MGCAMTRVVSVSSPRLLKAHHIFYAEVRMMGVLMLTAAWGEGVHCSLSPQQCAQQHWLGSWARPLPCAHLRPHPHLDEYISNKSQKDLDDLMGEPPEFFPTHACNVYSPIGKIGTQNHELE